MSEPRKHHYIPQFYLRQFAIDEKVTQIEKQTGRRVTTHINNVAAIRDYYRIDHDDVNDQFQLEKNLSEIEDKLNGALVNVVANGSIDLDLRARLVELVSMLRMRVPAVKSCIEEHLRQVVRTSGSILEKNGKHA